MRTEQLGGEGEGQKKKCDVQEKSALPEKIHVDRCEEVVEDGSGLCESMER